MTLKNQTSQEEIHENITTYTIETTDSVSVVSTIPISIEYTVLNFIMRLDINTLEVVYDKSGNGSLISYSSTYEGEQFNIIFTINDIEYKQTLFFKNNCTYFLS